MAEKTVGEKLKEELFLKKENPLKNISDEKWAKVTDFAEAYKTFMTKAKTEREGLAIASSRTVRGSTARMPSSACRRYRPIRIETQALSEAPFDFLGTRKQTESR